MNKRLRILSALILWALLAAPLPAAGPATQPAAGSDLWYTILTNGKPSGWVHSTVVSDGQKITSTSLTHMAMKRGGGKVEVSTTTIFVETPQGQPIEATVKEDLSNMEMVQTLKFHDDTLELTTTQAGRTQTSTTPAPKDAWLPPEASCRYIRDQLAAGAKEIKYRTLDPSAGTDTFEVDAKIVGPAKVLVMGKPAPATECLVSQSNMASLVTHEFVDADGRQVKATTPAGGIELTIVQADQQTAQALTEPPEMILSVLIHPDKPIQNPRMVKSAVFELKIAEPKPGEADPAVTIPRGGSQRVVWGDSHTARVVVDLSQPLNPGDDLPKPADSAASALVDSNDPEVQKLLANALKLTPADAPAARRAETLRQFVYHFISRKDLSVGFASASEVARNPEGDCSQHAVLLTALLRAARIPARTVSGLVYVDEFVGKQSVFGYHMWTQAWLADSGQWIDLDPTLSPNAPFDATHIALAVSSLSDATADNDMVKLMLLVGRLSIKVVETRP